MRVRWCFSFKAHVSSFFNLEMPPKHPHPMSRTLLQRKVHTLFFLQSWGVPKRMSSSFWGATEDQYANKHDFAITGVYCEKDTKRKWHLSVLIENDGVPGMQTMLD